MDPNKKSLGMKIRNLRKLKGLTQMALCEEEKSLSVRQLSRIENDETSPTVDTLAYIANRLSTTLIHLLSDYPSTEK